jgi:HPt (histidine-containing phosphotransfer) domain-containing protein
MIDTRRLDMLRGDLGADGVQEIMAIFIEEAEQHLARLAAAEDAAEQERPLHSLRGGALNLGFADLALAARAAETAVRAGRALGADDIADLRALWQVSRAAFARLAPDCLPA